MPIPTQQELIAEFCAYVRDICAQPPEQQGNRLETVMARFADSSVRIAASSLVPADTDLAALPDDDLAESMQRHVTFRNGARLPNSAWSMMLEAAKRLRVVSGAMGLRLALENCLSELKLYGGGEMGDYMRSTKDTIAQAEKALAAK